MQKYNKINFIIFLIDLKEAIDIMQLKKIFYKLMKKIFFTHLCKIMLCKIIIMNNKNSL